MKRHNSLIPISKEHHDVLILAQLLKKDTPKYRGLPETYSGKRKYALNFFRSKLVNHFEIEENILIPFVLGKNKEIDILSEEILRQHKEIAEYFEQLRTGSGIPEIMDNLGKLLSLHVRLEERKYFQLIQSLLPEEDLINLGSDITSFLFKMNKDKN